MRRARPVLRQLTLLRALRIAVAYCVLTLAFSFWLSAGAAALAALLAINLPAVARLHRRIARRTRPA